MEKIITEIFAVEQEYATVKTIPGKGAIIVRNGTIAGLKHEFGRLHKELTGETSEIEWKEHLSAKLLAQSRCVCEQKNGEELQGRSLEGDFFCGLFIEVSEAKKLLEEKTGGRVLTSGSGAILRGYCK